MNMFWYGEPVSGDFQIQFESYKGGTMSQDGYNFVNTGGASVQNLIINHSSNNRKPIDVAGYDYDGATVAKLTFDSINKTGTLSKIS